MSFLSADWRREIYIYAMLPLHGPYGWCIDFSFAPSCFLLLIRNNNGGRIDSRCSYSCFPFRGCSFVFFKNGTFSRKAAGRPAPSCPSPGWLRSSDRLIHHGLPACFIACWLIRSRILLADKSVRLLFCFAIAFSSTLYVFLSSLFI